MATIKQGYLQKYSSGIFKGWKQKYFVLYADGHLVVHDTRGGPNTGSFLVHRDFRDIQVGAGIQAKIPQLPLSHTIDLVFLLIMREKRFLLIAENRMEFDSWMQVLNNARSPNNGYSVGQSGGQYPTSSASYGQSPPINPLQTPYQPQPTAPPPPGNYYQPSNSGHQAGYPSAPPSYAPPTNYPPSRPMGPALGFENLSLNPSPQQPGPSGYNAYPPQPPPNQQYQPGPSYPPQPSNYPIQPPYNQQQGYQQPYYPQQPQGYAPQPQHSGYGGGSAYNYSQQPQQQGYYNNKPQKSSGLGGLGSLGGVLGSAGLGSVLGGGGKKSKRNKALLGGGAAALVGGYALSKVGGRGSWGSWSSFGSFGSFGSCGS